jgi:hypothetical protein
MFSAPNFKSSVESAPRAVTDTLVSWARAGLLALPLSGCAGLAHDSIHARESVVSLAQDTPEQRFTPPAGLTLVGIDYRDGLVIPRFSPTTSATEPFSPAEIERLHQLLSPDAALRCLALNEITTNYQPRLEPALIGMLLHEHEGALAKRATEILRQRCGSQGIGILCDEIQRVRGQDLERCLEILSQNPSNEIAQAFLRAIRTSEFGEKEARDESMILGKTLVTMAPFGYPLIRELLTDKEPSMRLAAAVSLASISDTEALPVLLHFSSSQDFNYRLEALAALSKYPNHPEILLPLEKALTERDFASTALFTLTEVGSPAFRVLVPYADPEYFRVTNVERLGRNPYLPGISYGEVVAALVRCHDLQTIDASNRPHYLFDKIGDIGVRKLMDDLEHEQLRPGAQEGFLALGESVHRYIPALLMKTSAKPLLLAYPVETLALELAPYLQNDALSSLTIEACALLSEGIRRPIKASARGEALQTVIDLYPNALWLRHLLGLVWQEDCDGEWVCEVLVTRATNAWACSIVEEINAALTVGIDVPLRWSRDNLAEIIRNRTATEFDGRPIATMIYAEADYNGAFGAHNPIVEALTRHGYCVMYYDESTDLGVVRALKDSVTRPGSTSIQPAALIIFGAHSSRTEMVFGRKSSAEAKITPEDQALITRELGDYTLGHNGQVILIACSAGEGREKSENIANMMRQIFTHAKEGGIWSTEIPDNVRSVTFDATTKELIDVQFIRGRIYRR